MTELSPAAQAVLDASWKELDYAPNRHLRWSAAAAIEALADQVVPHLEEPDFGACDEMHCDIELYTDHMRKRSKILAIAAELRGQSTSQED